MWQKVLQLYYKTIDYRAEILKKKQAIVEQFLKLKANC